MGENGVADNHQDYVFHDGAWVKAGALVKMSKNAGSMLVAEHYLCSLLYHAVIHKEDWILKEVNEVRKWYNAIPYPTSVFSSSDNMTGYTPEKDIAEIAREKYKKMTHEERLGILKESLRLIWLHHSQLFNKKYCWIGIFLVIRDRLGYDKTKEEFYDFAKSFTPEGWKDSLKIGNRPLSNMTRYLNFEDREMAYYEMQNNPWEELCTEYWNILIELILTQD